MTELRRARLRRVASSIVDGPFGSNLASEHYVDDGARVVRLGNIGPMSFNNDDRAFIDIRHFERLRRHEVMAGDLLVAGLGDSGHAVGRTCVAPTGLGPAIVKADCFRLRVREDLVDRRFVAWFMNSTDAEHQVALSSRGATRVRATPDVIIETAIPLFTLNYQRQIADFLDDQVARIDNIVAARETQVALVKSERDALADRILGEVSEYVTSRLGLFVRRIEQGWSPQCEAVPAELGEWGVLKVSAVRPGRFLATENKRLPDGLAPLQEYEVRAGDLFVTRANTPSLVGAFAVAPEGTRTRLIFSDKIMRITLTDIISPDFVGLVGQSRPVRDILSSAGTGTSQSMVNIRGSDIRDLRVPVIDRSRQQEIVALHRDEDAQLVDKSDLLARQVALVLELRRSLITAAVTGEFDVTAADGSQVPL